jgi:hypothetical protein
MQDDIVRRDLIEAANRVAGSIADDDTPGWNTPDELLEWVRALRRDSDNRFGHRLDAHQPNQKSGGPRRGLSQ